MQTATEAQIAESGALDLSDFLNRRLNGVYVNEVQGNPFQPDLNYRGYTASPLLGTPQGLSVYMDGVRLNQPFGDVVSWDLIPRVAIAEMTLVPGSNPLYGLNTLGGAVSIQTKDGLDNIAARQLELSGGSFGRGSVEFEHGGAAQRIQLVFWPAICPSRTAGAPTRRRMCGNSSASSAGRTRRPSSGSRRPTPTIR